MVSVASQQLMDKLQMMYPWMTQQFLDVYAGEWTVSESDQFALSAVRNTSAYQHMFAGNFDPETGEVRMSEADYMSSRQAFNSMLRSFDLNPDYFADNFVTAIENELSPTEMIGRMEAAYDRIVQSSDEVRKYYADNYGIEMSDAAILASAIDPNVGQKILDRQISIAEIGGSAATRGFDIGTEFASMIEYELGGSRGSDEFFSEARNLIPMMEVLEARHGDPDDPFDLGDVSANLLFDDPETRRRIRRARAQEASTFTGGAQLDYVRARTGGVAGLAQSG